MLGVTKEYSEAGIINVLSQFREMGTITHYCIWQGEIIGFISEETAIQWSKGRDGFERGSIKEMPKDREEFLVFSLIEIEARLNNLTHHVCSQRCALQRPDEEEEGLG